MSCVIKIKNKHIACKKLLNECDGLDVCNVYTAVSLISYMLLGNECLLKFRRRPEELEQVFMYSRSMLKVL